MAPLCNFLVLAVGVTAASAFVTPATVARPATTLSESFGFDFAEDSYENTPEQLLGEANYKQWVGKVSKNSFLNRQVCFNVISAHGMGFCIDFSMLYLRGKQAT
jgi:hypothetical protein